MLIISISGKKRICFSIRLNKFLIRVVPKELNLLGSKKNFIGLELSAPYSPIAWITKSRENVIYSSHFHTVAMPENLSKSLRIFTQHCKQCILMYLRANSCAHINVTKICVYNEAICDTYETCFFERYSLKPTSTTCWQAVRIPENQDFMTLVCHHSNRDIAQPLIGIW